MCLKFRLSDLVRNLANIHACMHAQGGCAGALQWHGPVPASAPGWAPNLYGPGVNLNFEFMDPGKPAAHLMEPGMATAATTRSAFIRRNSKPKACCPVQSPAGWASQTGSSRRSWPP